MENLLIRKRIAVFSNKQLDEFLQRVVEVSDSLKNNTLSQSISDLKKSAKEFHDMRVAIPTTAYTKKIHETGNQADEIFMRIKLAVWYTEAWQTGQPKEAAQKVKTILSCYGNIPNAGIVKKFVDYDSLAVKLRAETNAVSTLKLENCLNQIQTLTKEYRQDIVNRETYWKSLKGKRKEARLQALNDYKSLRNKIEALAEINGEAEVSNFVWQVNQALIRIAPNEKK